MKFPLFFGYWKKYADLEFSIAGTEAAEMVRASPGAKVHMLKLSRFMNAASQASSIPQTCGQTTAPSRPKLATIQISSESKYRAVSLPSLISSLHIHTRSSRGQNKHDDAP
jgi:hypothetical protein